MRPGAAGVIASACTGHDYSSPGKPRIDWSDPAAKDALVSALVNDANLVVGAFAGAGLDEAAAAAIGLLALVAGQDVEPAEGSDGTDGRRKIARRISSDRVISVHDQRECHTRKSSSARRDGYRPRDRRAGESSPPPRLAMASGENNSDAAVAGELIAAEPGPARVYGDTNYGTGERRTALAAAGHQAVIKPHSLTLAGSPWTTRPSMRLPPR